MAFRAVNQAGMLCVTAAHLAPGSWPPVVLNKPYLAERGRNVLSAVDGIADRRALIGKDDFERLPRRCSWISTCHDYTL